MSKNWMIIAGVAALVVVAIGAALVLMSGNAPLPFRPIAGGPAGAGSSAASSGQRSAAGTSTGITQGATTTSPTATSGSSSTTATGGSAGKTTTDGTTKATTTGGPATNPNLTPLKPFPALPDPHLPAHAAKAPAPAGQTLAPLTNAPAFTISALKLGSVPDGASYTIVMRPYGIGPSTVLGSRLVIRVDSAKPLAGAPANSQIANANLLVLVDTKHGGTVTKGGTYTLRLTFRSDGTKLLPIMSKAPSTK